MPSLFGIVFDGVAYGSLLFLISVGLSVTMGLMNIVNLAHGAFAMFGGYLSVWLSARGVPWFGLTISFVTGVICFLPFPSWQELVGFITSASVLMYAGAPLAFGALRRRLPDRERSYRLPFGEVVAPLSFVVATLIIYWTGWHTLARLGIAILIGYLLLGSYAAYAVRKGLPNAPRLDWRPAQWLPAYLVGLGLISWVANRRGR